MKILLRIFLIIFFLSILSFLKTDANPVYASHCIFSVSPTNVTTRSENITVRLNNLHDKTRYTVSFDNSNAGTVLVDADSSGTKTIIVTLDSIGYRGASNSKLGVYVRYGGFSGNLYPCSPSTGIEIIVGSGSPTTGSCSINIGEANVGDDITVTPNNFPSGGGPLPVDLVGNFLTPVVRLGELQGNTSGIYLQGTFKIPDTISGGYQVLVNFTLSPPGGTSCGPLTIGTGGGLTSGRNPCPGGTCITALGPIPTNLKEFSEKILSIATGIAGGIAFILMVVGAIRILTSQGDPKGVAGGREMLVAALAGLLFLIFSVLILRFIGINLLGGIPGIS